MCPKIKGYILDIDGTLLSSHSAHLSAWKRALREYGILKAEQEIVAHFGKPTPNIALELTENQDFHMAQDIALQKTEYFLQEIKHIRLYPGVEEILQEIHASNIPICFASSNYNRVLEKMYDNYGWKKIATGFIGIDDVKQSKPAPEMILKAAKKIDQNPKDCIVIGDSLYDLQAGHAAKTKTAVVCTKNTKSFWQTYNPDLILSEFQELKPLLPLFMN